MPTTAPLRSRRFGDARRLENCRYRSGERRRRAFHASSLASVRHADAYQLKRYFSTSFYCPEYRPTFARRRRRRRRCRSRLQYRSASLTRLVLRLWRDFSTCRFDARVGNSGDFESGRNDVILRFEAATGDNMPLRCHFGSHLIRRLAGR